MEKTKLTWFDRLMIGITYAEAGEEAPVQQREAGEGHRHSASAGSGEELFEPGRNCTIPAHS